MSYSHMGDPTPSALLRFTSDFGMESGGSKVLWSPNKFCDVSFELSIEIDGADTQNRTGDLILTRDALYQLSHISTQNLKHVISNVFCKLNPGDVLLSHRKPHTTIDAVSFQF